MATRLNQLLAIDKTQQAETKSVVTKSHHALQTSSKTVGIHRSYQPLDEADTDRLPDEGTLVQVRAGEEIQRVRKAWGDLMDVTAKKDWTNQSANADVVLSDGTVLVEGAPTTFLLWLEKRLEDIYTYVSKIPELNPGIEWEYDPNTDTYRSKPTETARNKKEPRVVTLAPSTDKHPAQTQLLMEDKRVGTFTTTHFSGGMPRKDIQALKERVREVAKASKQAREQANLVDVDDIEVADRVLDYIFG